MSSLLIDLAGVHLCIDHHSYQGVHYQTITSNISLHLSHSLFQIQMNCKIDLPTRISVTILEYSDAFTELQLTFPNVYHILF